jgi:hypothetical protein
MFFVSTFNLLNINIILLFLALFGGCRVELHNCLPKIQDQ